MYDHRDLDTEPAVYTADRTAVECTVVDYTVAVRWDFAVPVVAAAAVEQSAVPVAAVVPAAAVVGVSAVPAAVVGVSAVPVAVAAAEPAH